MKTTIKWVLGIFFILAGAGAAGEGMKISGLFSIILGALLIPPIWEEIVKKFPKINQTITRRGIWIALLVLSGAFSSKKDKQVSENKPLTDEERVENCFSKWDGSNPKLVDAIKEKMNDPSSFEHVKTGYSRMEGNKVFIRCSFRGKNAFGALVLQSATVTMDFDCEITDFTLE